jgi:O-antigen/teichoic acid export membrane protein
VHTLVISLASVGIGLAASVVVARALGPDGKGSYDLMLATAALLVIVVGLSLESGIAFAVARTQSVPARLIAILGLIAVFQAVVAGAAVGVAQLTSLSAAFTPPSIGTAAVVPTGLLVGGTLMSSYLRSILMARDRVVAANWRDLANRVVGLGAVVAGVGAAGAGILGLADAPLVLLWLAVAASALAIVLFLAAVRPEVHPGGRVDLGPAMKFAAPSYVANVSQFLNYRLDLFLVSFFLGVEQVGLYAAATMFGQLIWLAANAVAATLLPRVAREAPEGHPHAPPAARLARMVLGASVCAALLLGVVSSWLVPWLLAPRSLPRSSPWCCCCRGSSRSRQ